MKTLFSFVLIILSARLCSAQQIEKKNAIGLSLGINYSMADKIPQASGNYYLLPNGYADPYYGIDYQRMTKDVMYGLGVNLTGDAMQVASKDISQSNILIKNIRMNFPLEFKVRYLPPESPVSFHLGVNLGISYLLKQNFEPVYNSDFDPAALKAMDPKTSFFYELTAGILFKATDRSIVKINLENITYGSFHNDFAMHSYVLSIGAAERF